MVIRAFNRLGSITAGWGRTSKKPTDAGRLSVDDRKKWASNQDCSGQWGSVWWSDQWSDQWSGQLFSGLVSSPVLTDRAGLLIFMCIVMENCTFS